MHRLKGHTLREITLDDDGYTLVIITDTHKFTYHSEGDCCAHAYILAPEPEDIAAVIGHKVIETSTHGFTSGDDPKWGEALDTEFYSIKTQFADLELELRTEHNGYYSGWISFTSQEELSPAVGSSGPNPLL